MPDLARLESALHGDFPQPWVRHHLASFPPSYFATFDAADVARHLGQIIALTDEQPLAVHVESGGAGEWRVEVVGYDAFQLLSTVCSLLAIHGLSIVEGRAFTSHPPREPGRPAPRRGGAWRRHPPAHPARGPDRRPKIVDRFRVRRADGSAAGLDWDAFRAELMALARLLRDDRHEEVQHRLIGRFVAEMSRHRAGPATSEALDLTIDPDEDDSATVVRVGARDSFGFLSLTTSALALCGIRIIRADVRTEGGRVDDAFWVTDRFGRRIDDEVRLRELRLSLILIEHCSSYLPHATDPEAALVHFSRFARETMARPDWAQEYAALDRPEVLDALVRVLGESDFLWEDYLHAQPEDLLPMIGDPGQWGRVRTPAELAADRDAALSASSDLDEKARALRRFRDREFFRAGVVAILGRCGGPEGFSAALSDLAEALLQGADRVVCEELAAILPRRADGRPAPSALLALGKCGGRELGFGSDLELMLVYDDRDIAEVIGSAGAGACFDRFVAILRQVLAARRGGTFEIDFRLRPYGRAGTPATALSVFAGYYWAGGPAWGYERQALIKLRAVAGDPGLGRAVEGLRDRYVYGPEPFDLEGCRRLRRLQVEQKVRPGTVNAKYSPGALVDVEYLVQALQIVHGAGDPAVRTPNTLDALGALEGRGHLDPGRAETLRSAYLLFRAMIDALRVVHGHAKDLTIPPPGSVEFQRLARRLRRPDPAQLRAEVDRALLAVQALWAEPDRLLPGTR
jgi:[glutamine synthetase] adenylyltransferase / [glutamine synthetase]-adenylyl-L-tyrosine phosphorylase